MRSVLKLLPLAALGLAAALLVACGDRSGLLSGGQSGSLQDALAAVQAACADGNPGRAAVAARSFSDRVGALPAGEVDRRLVADLEEGASTLETLVPQSCTAAATTTTTPTDTTTTAPTTTSTTPTTTTTTAPTTPTTPTEPPATTPTAPPPTAPPDDDSGGPGNSGGAPGNPGGAAPGQVKKALRELERAARR